MLNNTHMILKFCKTVLFKSVLIFTSLKEPNYQKFTNMLGGS